MLYGGVRAHVFDGYLLLAVYILHSMCVVSCWLFHVYKIRIVHTGKV